MIFPTQVPVYDRHIVTNRLVTEQMAARVPLLITHGTPFHRYIPKHWYEIKPPMGTPLMLNKHTRSLSLFTVGPVCYQLPHFRYQTDNLVQSIFFMKEADAVIAKMIEPEFLDTLRGMVAQWNKRHSYQAMRYKHLPMFGYWINLYAKASGQPEFDYMADQEVAD